MLIIKNSLTSHVFIQHIFFTGIEPRWWEEAVKKVDRHEACPQWADSVAREKKNSADRCLI